MLGSSLFFFFFYVWWLGGHWPRKGVWGCADLKTPFSRLSCSSQGSHFKQKGQFTRPPFEKIWKFYPLQPQFSPEFQLTSPQIWKFSAHKPPNLEIFSSQAPPLFRGKYQFASPTLWKSGPHTPTWKKVECPPMVIQYMIFQVLIVICVNIINPNLPTPVWGFSVLKISIQSQSHLWRLN